MSQVIARGVHAIVGHPWIVIGLWAVAILATVVLLVPGLGKVPQTELSLPSGTDSVRAQNILQQHFPDRSHADTLAVVVVDDHGLQIRDAQIATRPGMARQQSFASSVAPRSPARTARRCSSRSPWRAVPTPRPTAPRSSTISPIWICRPGYR